MDAKPLLIVILFVFILAIIASGIIGNVNLTDSGITQPPSGTSGTAGTTEGLNYNVFSDSSSSSSQPATSGSGNMPGLLPGQPITGSSDGKSTSAQNSPCGSTYTVQSGDTLSKIARTCLISVEDMLAVNPTITNPNVIAVGQKITIFRSSLPIVTKQPGALATVAPTAGNAAAAGPGFSATLQPGLKAGSTVKVEVQGFPAYAEVEIGIGIVGKTPTIVKKILTDQAGVIKTTVSIPMTAKANEKWTVTLTTTRNPRVKITAEPFVINK